MLEKESAVELVMHIKNKLDIDVALENMSLDISLQDVRNYAYSYMQEYCSKQDLISDIFSDETIAYVYALTQGSR